MPPHKAPIPPAPEITPHEINHGLWFSLKVGKYTPVELARHIGVQPEEIRPTLGDWERRGFVRRSGFRYTSAIAMPIRKEGDRFVYRAHKPLIH